MSFESDAPSAEVKFAIDQLRKGKPLDDFLERGDLLQADIDAAREQIRAEEERRDRRRRQEAENSDRGGLSCRRCSGFVAGEDADRFGSRQDGYAPPYCEPCWVELERPLLEKRLLTAGVPQKPRQDALAFGRAAYTRPPGKPFTLIVGPIGVGKTTRAARMLFDVREGKFISLVWLAQKHEEARAARSMSPLSELAEYGRLLILDEAGDRLYNERPSLSWARVETFRYIVHHRHAHALPTVITSNWTLEQIEAAYGEMVGSRLEECAHVVTMKETKDLRRTRRKKPS